MAINEPVTPNLVVVDAASSTDTSISSTGVHDKNKTTVLEIELNAAAASGVGIVKYEPNIGSSQTFSGGAPAWLIHQFGPTGGILMKADRSAFAVAGLPAAAATFRSVIAFCTDGVRVCNGSAWETFTNAD